MLKTVFNPFNICAALFALVFLVAAGKSEAGYLYQGNCYATTADALQAFSASYPLDYGTKIEYLSAAATISATGLITATIASKAPTAVTVTAGVANTYQLTACTAPTIASPQQYLASSVAFASSAAVATASMVASNTAQQNSLASMVSAATSDNALNTTLIGVNAFPCAASHVCSNNSVVQSQAITQDVIIYCFGAFLLFLGFSTGQSLMIGSVRHEGA